MRPALADHGIRVVSVDELEGEEAEAADRLFYEQVFPVLTPLAVGPGRPFPYISNLSLSLAVWLRDPVTELELFARVKVPKEVLPRFMAIGDSKFVPIESLIARHLDALFPGMDVQRHAYFRVTRDADFEVSGEADDLLRAVEAELRQRRFGEVVRLEVSADMDPQLRTFLVESLGAEESEVEDVRGLLDLNDLMQLHGLDGHSDLREEPWKPVSAGPFSTTEGKPDVLGAMRNGDLLVHHPYDSFATSVERLVEQAVNDPQVLAIKMTVYRTSDDSDLVPLLIEAAERGKQAVCLVELKARFDERRNIRWARALEEAGAHVVHGLPGLKTHAKALLVVRREGAGVRHFVHVGTGNYHAKTARLYEDFGLLTCDPDVAADVSALFNALTGAARNAGYRKAIVAPDHMRDRLLAEIEQTVEAHREGQHARIVLKLNSLVDRRCIKALYEASQAGVQVDLNVRGICALRAGVPGVSENIRVVSVVGRFLEHARVYGFQRGDERLVLHRLRGPHAPQPRHARGAADARGGPAPASGRRGHPGAVPGGRHLRLGHAARRLVEAPHRRQSQRPPGADAEGAGAGFGRGLGHHEPEPALERQYPLGGLGHPLAKGRVAAGAAQQARVDLVPAARARHEHQVHARRDRALRAPRPLPSGRAPPGPRCCR